MSAQLLTTSAQILLLARLEQHVLPSRLNWTWLSEQSQYAIQVHSAAGYVRVICAHRTLNNAILLAAQVVVENL